MKNAILFGASGFVGSYLLLKLLNDADYGHVTVVVRKPLNIDHPKLTTLIGDYHSLPDLKDKLVADELFIALGATRKSAPERHEYYRVDHDYPVLAAKLCREKGTKSVFLVSTVGANANSRSFYLRTKGETERDIIALGFEHIHLFRPSMLMGHRKENRPMEKVVIKIWSVINPIFFGKLNSFRGIDGKDVAKAMSNAAKYPTEKVKIYQWKEMRNLL
jgi:uncharacterized protein YbjT (DUF2867 family)